jgi:SAM-dependent methyltransferase
MQSARQLLELVCRACGLRDLADSSVLDVGCGTKIAKALLDDRRLIARYVGIDVEPRVIEFLRANVDDERFAFHHIDVQNDLYNPDGLPLAERTELPLGDETFDIIWLFSVFTHVAPDDYVAMLRLLRRYVRDDGWLVFSLFVNEVTGTGYGPLELRAQHLAREIERQVAEQGDAQLVAELERRRQAGGEPVLFVTESGQLSSSGTPPDFVDLVPDKPLLQAIYSRSYAHELIEGTGWDVVSLNLPEPQYIQHYFVCRPD